MTPCIAARRTLLLKPNMSDLMLDRLIMQGFR